jgi:hypothetical protein
MHYIIMHPSLLSCITRSLLWPAAPIMHPSLLSLACGHRYASPACSFRLQPSLCITRLLPSPAAIAMHHPLAPLACRRRLALPCIPPPSFSWCHRLASLALSFSTALPLCIISFLPFIPVALFLLHVSMHYRHLLPSSIHTHLQVSGCITVQEE